MNAGQQITAQYLRSRPSDLWDWKEEASVLVWSDGSTIAFRQEAMQVLRALPQDHLPPFGAVVLLLAALRGRVPTLTDFSSGPTGEALAKNFENLAAIESALGELRRLQHLPETMRTSIAAKCSLARAVFESVPGRSVVHRERLHLSEDLFRGLEPADLVSYDDPSDGEKHRCLHLVAAGLRHHTTESLLLRHRTGLDALPGRSDTKITLPATQARNLLEELLQDAEWRPLAMAARRLMAATHLPRRLHVSDELAVGGVADISNRGSIDKLLLSELAYDDLTLATRVALSEALYLRHEPPEHQPPLARCLLIDSGIRLWGLPRLMTAAAALAFVGEDLKLESVRAWKPQGKGWLPVDLLTRQGLTDFLETLDISTHPGEALRSIGETLDVAPATQLILLTHPGVLADADFREHLAKADRAPDFIATVDRLGRFALHAAPFHSSTPIAESVLDVESLFSDPSTRSLTRASAEAASLPQFIRMHPCPMLLPISGRVEYCVHPEPNRCVAALTDRKLVEYYPLTPQVGGRVICPRIPPGRKVWAEEIDGFVYLIHAGSARRPNRWVRCQSGSTPEAIDLCGGEPACAVIRYDRTLLLIREHDVYAYSLDDAKLLDRKVSPSRWHRGRFFTSNQQFHVVHWDGKRIEFHSIVLPPQLGLSGIVAVFDREGVEGPWALNQLCQAFPIDGSERIQIPLPIAQTSHHRNAHISRDGHRIHVSIPSLNWDQLFDLQANHTLPRPPRGAEAGVIDPVPRLPAHPMSRSFDAVAIVGAELRLRSRKGDHFVISIDDQHRCRMTPCDDPPGAQWLSFTTLSEFHPEAQGFHLQVAITPSDGRIFLDSRGLLHLRSPNPADPQATVSLGPGRLALWTTVNGLSGPGFFLSPGTEEASPVMAARTFTQITLSL